MSISPLEYLRHILDEATYLKNQSVLLTHEVFLEDETAKRAFVRSIEIIGEATKRLPAELQERHPADSRLLRCRLRYRLGRSGE